MLHGLAGGGGGVCLRGVYLRACVVYCMGVRLRALAHVHVHTFVLVARAHRCTLMLTGCVERHCCVTLCGSLATRIKALEYEFPCDACLPAGSPT